MTDTYVFPASFGQERLWMLHEMGAGSAYHVSGALRLTGELDADCLRQALQLLVDRHEALRTGVEIGEGGAVTQVAISELTVPFTTGDTAEAGLDDAIRAVVEPPFTLSAPPLLRARLLRITDAPEPQWVLVLCVHHIVVDGWSLGILVAELGAAYSSLVGGTPPRWPEPEMQYADFAMWQRDFLTGDEVAGQLEFWRTTLSGATALDLVTDHPRGAATGYRGGTVRAVLPDVLVKRLATAAQAENATEFMVFVTAWSVVLSRWSGQDDLVIGTPVAGRPSDELDGVVGFFVNTVPLRLRLDPHETLRQALGRCRSVCLAALAHQDVPFEWISQERGDGPKIPQTLLALQNTPSGSLSLPGVQVQPVEVHSGGAQFDVGLYLAPGDDCLAAELTYSTGLFEEASARRVLDAFVTVLTEFTDHLDAPLWTIPVLSAAERDQVVAMSGSTELTEPLPSITEWFGQAAGRAPDAVAVVADATGDSVTYRELDTRAAEVASWLRANGVQVGDCVGVCLERGVDLAVAVLAVLKAGGAYLPLDPDHPDGRLAAVLSVGRPGIVLTSATTRARITGGPRVADIGEVTGEPVAPVEVPGDSASYVVFTSGSTGEPKGAVNTVAGLANRLRAAQARIPLGAADVVAQKTPIGFDVAVPEILGPLLAGARLVFAAPAGHRDPRYLGEFFARHGVTQTHFVPSMLRQFLDQGVTGADVPQLRRVLCSGEELPARLAADFLAAFPGVELHNMYGPAEAAVEVTHCRVEPSMTGRRIPIGDPLPGVRLLLLDAHGQPVPVGVPGELHIAGVQTARAYLGRARATAAAFLPHENGTRVYRTGDRAYWNSHGQLTFLGRTDHQVKIRGQRVEPAEIASTMRSHPAVTDAVVVVRPDHHGTPRLIGYLVADGDVALDELRRHLADRLPAAMVPGRFVTVPSFPVNANGKVDQAALPLPPADLAESVRVPPRTPVETLLVKLWADVLGVPEVGIRDDFYELGGDSLRAVNLLQRTRELGLDFPLQVLLGRHTIEELAELAPEGRG
ncbi:non-ribosomal peptide synthetase [Nocardia sp. NRRL S-836]|uniref:non-ribosomal peptide synthetase n=1 Tax=Nocardia sp. NRRL S-836 TaxID=1519492 RepID=UPI0006AFF8C9|nr:non-ribosomal peptide synthetase [Nocardia sp. NRRL S-836]